MPRLRLLQLASPSLPVGAFTYSQGLEWAVECGWVHDEATLADWLADLLEHSMGRLEVPVLARLYRALEMDDQAALAEWSGFLLASRETRELRAEERHRGRALTTLLPELGIPLPRQLLESLRSGQLAGFALAAHHWRIPLAEAAAGHLWSWLENSTLAGVKLVPLGQSAGQRIITRLSASIPAAIAAGLALEDAHIGGSCPGQALASSLHESQYSRLYRS